MNIKYLTVMVTTIGLSFFLAILENEFYLIGFLFFANIVLIIIQLASVSNYFFNFKNLLDNINFPVFVSDKNSILYINNKAREDLNILEVKSFWKTQIIPDKELVKLIWGFSLKDLNDSKKTLTLKSGEKIFVKVLVRQVRFNGKNVNLFCIENQNETESLLKQVEEEMGQLNEYKCQLQNMDVHSADFINYITHELKTPLTAIRLSTSMLLENKNIGKNKIEEYVLILRNEGIQLEKIINNIIQLIKIEANQLNPNFAISDLEENIVKAVYLLKEKLERKRIEVVLRLDKELKRVFIDSERMFQVFKNLIDNSIKYGDVGSKIIIKGKRIFSEGHFEIQNFGQLIPEGLGDEVFKKFYKSNKNRGAGIGLHVTKKIIDMHNGEIWVEDNKNEVTGKKEGAVFKFFIKVEDKKFKRIVNEEDFY